MGFRAFKLLKVKSEKVLREQKHLMLPIQITRKRNKRPQSQPDHVLRMILRVYMNYHLSGGFLSAVFSLLSYVVLWSRNF